MKLICVVKKDFGYFTVELCFTKSRPLILSASCTSSKWSNERPLFFDRTLYLVNNPTWKSKRWWKAQRCVTGEELTDQYIDLHLGMGMTLVRVVCLIHSLPAVKIYLQCWTPVSELLKSPRSCSFVSLFVRVFTADVLRQEASIRIHMRQNEM